MRDDAIVVALPYVFALGTVFAFWVAWSGLHAFLAGMQARTPLVSLMPHDLIGIPAGILFLCLALLTFPPVSTMLAARRANRTEARFPIGSLLIGASLLGVVGVFVASPLASLLSDAAATRHGYQRCGPPRQWTAHPPATWALPGTRCP